MFAFKPLLKKKPLPYNNFVSFLLLNTIYDVLNFKRSWEINNVLSI